MPKTMFARIPLIPILSTTECNELKAKPKTDLSLTQADDTVPVNLHNIKTVISPLEQT
jgi:hypothetical protein